MTEEYNRRLKIAEDACPYSDDLIIEDSNPTPLFPDGNWSIFKDIDIAIISEVDMGIEYDLRF